NADLPTAGDLVAHVGTRGWIGAHEDDGERRPDSVRREQCVHARVVLRAQMVGDGFAVDDLGGHDNGEAVSGWQLAVSGWRLALGGNGVYLALASKRLVEHVYSAPLGSD